MTVLLQALTCSNLLLVYTIYMCMRMGSQLPVYTYAYSYTSVSEAGYDTYGCVLIQLYCDCCSSKQTATREAHRRATVENELRRTVTELSAAKQEVLALR
jgi:hypothetical protein